MGGRREAGVFYAAVRAVRLVTEDVRTTTRDGICLDEAMA